MKKENSKENRNNNNHDHKKFTINEIKNNEQQIRDQNDIFNP